MNMGRPGEGSTSRPVTIALAGRVQPGKVDAAPWGRLRAGTKLISVYGIRVIQNCSSWPRTSALDIFPDATARISR